MARRWFLGRPPGDAEETNPRCLDTTGGMELSGRDNFWSGVWESGLKGGREGVEGAYLLGAHESEAGSRTGWVDEAGGAPGDGKVFFFQQLAHL